MQTIMNTTKYIVLLAAIALISNGCKKFLNEKPQTQVPVDLYFKTVKDVNATLAGIYASFQQEMTGGGTSQTYGKYHYWGEGRSDNFERSQYTNIHTTELTLNQLTANNDISNWTGLYRTIGRANTGIKYIPLVPDYDVNATPAFINNSLAQCYAMRAMSYFYIVRLWGDAPIWTEPFTDVAESPARPRDSKDKIINELILPDLQKAYELTAKNQNANIWYLNEAAICAILADVYMWKKDHASAIIWIQNLFKARNAKGAPYRGVDENDLMPAATWKTNFTNPVDSKEAIWSIHWDFTVNGCACATVSVYHSNNLVKIDSTVWRDWQATTDLRARQTIDFASSLQEKVYKYHVPPSSGNPQWNDASKQKPVYLVMYRLSDIYLLYAEALNKTGGSSEAIRYLNIIRTRAGLPAYAESDPAVNTPEALENTLLNERRWELFAEGKRWFDLVRTDHVKQVMDPSLKIRQRRIGGEQIGFGEDMGRILWPINRTLLEDNRELEQNASYK